MSPPIDRVDDLAAWNAASSLYAATVDGTDSISARFASFLAEELEPVEGRQVLDLGCGHGWLAGQLAAQGAAVVGVDGSTELLNLARQQHPEVEFHHADLNHGLGRLSGRSFDRVVAHMVLMDVADLDNLLADVAAVLTPQGRLVFTMTHPCFWAQSPVEDPETGERYRKVRGYLDHEERWVTSFGGHRHYHRPLSWYFDRLAAVGFAVTRLVEPPTPPRDNRGQEQWSDYEAWMATIPTMIGLSARRLGI